MNDAVTRRIRIPHRIEYAAVRAVSGIVRLLPERVALGTCAAIGWMAGSALRVRRSTVDANLALAFPDRPSSWRAALARRCYAHLGRETGALLRTTLSDPEWTRRYVLNRTRFADEQSESTFRWMQERSTRGDGTVVVTGHLGNWEIGASALSVRGLPLTAVAVGQANPLVDRRLRSTRDQLGVQALGKSEAPTRVGRALADGRVVAIVGDQNARRAGVFVDFFGRSASTARGTALFALRADVPVVLGVALREPGWPQRYRVHLERVPWTPSGERDEDVTTLTAAHTRVLERHVRGAPEQYLWQHKRWRPGGERVRTPEEPSREAPVLRS